MCYYNTIIKNPRYKKTKKNGGNIPPVTDPRTEYIPIGCGNCMECRRQKANAWRVRLLEHIKTNTNGKFITLTFSNEEIAKLINHTIKRTDKLGQIQTILIKNLKGYDRDNTIATKAVRLFTERWRKTFKRSIPHWLITELGHEGTENIHLHGIAWTNEHIDQIRDHWQYGWIWPRPKYEGKWYVNQRTINYMMKYVLKVDAKHKEYKPIILTSPGIGKNYTKTLAAINNIDRRTDTYKTNTGHEIAMPIYWRNKLFTEESREEMWIKKLDKQIRYVNKVPYDIRNGTKDYERAVQEARRINRELGYGGKPNDNRKHYEELQREIMLQTRIRNAGHNEQNTSKLKRLRREV